MWEEENEELRLPEPEEENKSIVWKREVGDLFQECSSIQKGFYLNRPSQSLPKSQVRFSKKQKMSMIKIFEDEKK